MTTEQRIARYEEITRQTREALERMKKQTYGFDSDYSAGYADGEQASYESFIEQMESVKA
jgi:hypothetical protein